MARIARIVVPGFPHQVTQRGNRREPIFFGPADFGLYLDFWRSAHPGRRRDLVLLPDAQPCPPHPEAGQCGTLRARSGAASALYGCINARLAGPAICAGAVRLGRDGRAHLIGPRAICAQPVAGRLVRGRRIGPGRARGASGGPRRRVVRVARCCNGSGLCARPARRRTMRTLPALRQAETTGRPLGSQSSLTGIERRLRRRVRPQRRGPKPRGATQAETMKLFPERNSAIGKVSP